MIKHYFKQSLQMLKENPLVNTISILGTAFSIAMILVIVLVFQINNANYRPESYRSRMLYVLGTEVFCEAQHQRNRGGMSVEVVRECFYTLRLPEAVTARVRVRKPVSLPAKRLFANYDIMYTDPGVWQVFDYAFLYGSPFTAADFESGIPRAVVSEETARKIFGDVDVVGREIVFDYVTYTICGIVRTVTQAAQLSSADVWVPYTSKAGLVEHASSYENMTGSFDMIILAHSNDQFAAIGTELEETLARYNTAKQDCVASFPIGTLTHLDVAMGSGGFRRIAMKDYLLNQGSILLFLLLIPAINLISVVLSSVRKRKSEIGLRKAFGATKNRIVSQILWENMLLTAIGAVAGLVLSFLFLYLGRSFLISKDVMLTADMLFKPGLFMAVLFFAVLLNLLSAGIPALGIAKRTITDSLNDTNS